MHDKRGEIRTSFFHRLFYKYDLIFNYKAKVQTIFKLSNKIIFQVCTLEQLARKQQKEDEGELQYSYTLDDTELL